MQIHNEIAEFHGEMEPAPKWGGLHVRPRIQYNVLPLREIEGFIAEDVGDDGFTERFVITVGGNAYPITEEDFFALADAWSEWGRGVV